MKKVLAGLVLIAAIVILVLSRPSYYIHGTFTENVTQQNLQNFVTAQNTYEKDVAILESFPPQFVIVFESKEQCENWKYGTAEIYSYIESVGECTKRESGGSDTPVSVEVE